MKERNIYGKSFRQHKQSARNRYCPCAIHSTNRRPFDTFVGVQNEGSH